MRPGAWLLVLLLAGAACGPRLAAQERPETNQAELQQKLQTLREEITSLRETISSTRTEYSGQQDQLKSTELSIQSISNTLRDIEQRLQQQNLLLESLLEQRRTLLIDLGLEQEELAELIRSAHKLRHPSKLKLMLNQDDLSSLGRNLAYYQYFNAARIAEIETLRLQLAELEQLEQSILDERARLEQLRIEQAEQLALKNAARAERQQLVQKLAARIDRDQKQLEELQKNRRDLESILERISEILVDIPAGLGQNLVLSELKGKLPAPLQGRILYAFGNQRAGGLSWQGWLYGVAAGSEVHSIAYGRVAFADWLRGYGLLMIIDHGDGFMSLYGHNDSLLRDVGDWVQAGELISLSGASGGLGRDGLYFELRKNGKALDPSGWISR